MHAFTCHHPPQRTSFEGLSKRSLEKEGEMCWHKMTYSVALPLLPCRVAAAVCWTLAPLGDCSSSAVFCLGEGL